MGRAYNVIDADGSILSSCWICGTNDLKFRDRAPRIVKGEQRQGAARHRRARGR